MIRFQSRRRRSGMVLLIVLVCLAVAAALVVNWARVGILQSRRMRMAEDRLQAVWLAQSAIGRATARLISDPGYQGETWQISPQEMGAVSTDAGGVALIKAESVDQRRLSRLISVTANFPANDSHSNQISKRVMIELPARKETP